MHASLNLTKLQFLHVIFRIRYTVTVTSFVYLSKMLLAFWSTPHRLCGSKLCQKGHFLSAGLIIDHRLSLLQSSISSVVAFLVTKCCPSSYCPSSYLRIQIIFIDTFVSILPASSLCLLVKSLNSNRGVRVLIHALKSLKVRIPHTYVPHWTEIDISI